MLKKCAPGHRVTEQPHSYRIDYGDDTYWNFPLGKRNQKDPEVQLPQVRKLVRHLKLEEDCVRRYLPQAVS